jgi:hypothetical protein
MLRTACLQVGAVCSANVSVVEHHLLARTLAQCVTVMTACAGGELSNGAQPAKHSHSQVSASSLTLLVSLVIVVHTQSMLLLSCVCRQRRGGQRCAACQAQPQQCTNK